MSETKDMNDERNEQSAVAPLVVRRFAPGDRIRFAEERRSYTVQACDDRYLICTKPFNPKRTVLYTIVDLVECVRGTENAIFCMGFETTDKCREALARLRSGESEISRRNRIPLKIV